MSATTDRVTVLVAPVVEAMGLTLYDVDQPGGTLRVMLDAPGGVDIDALAEASREISRVLDEREPVAGSYTLEVSSPGLERPLRRAEHYAAAVGEPIKVKLLPGVEGDRRAEGTLVAADADTFTIALDDGERTIAQQDVSKAHTVFEWTPAPKPGRSTQVPSPTAESPTTESSEDIR